MCHYVVDILESCRSLHSACMSKLCDDSVSTHTVSLWLWLHYDVCIMYIIIYNSSMHCSVLHTVAVKATQVLKYHHF